MRLVPAYLASLVFFVVTIPVFAQQNTQTATSDPQAVALLQKSLAALTGGQPISDVTLSGAVRRIAGSDDETGTATLKAVPGDAGRIDLALPSGQGTEILNSTTTPPTGSWSGPDAIFHPAVYHNLLTDSAWFFPAFSIAQKLSNSGYVATYIGQETHNGQAVQHISVSQTPPSQPASFATTFRHLTQVDFFLDSVTLLPAAIAFNIHPDNNALLDLPVEVRFGDYRAINGAQIPFHVQKFLNNSLLLDFQAQTVALNSGLSATLFAVQ